MIKSGKNKENTSASKCHHVQLQSIFQIWLESMHVVARSRLSNRRKVCQKTFWTMYWFILCRSVAYVLNGEKRLQSAAKWTHLGMTSRFTTQMPIYGTFFFFFTKLNMASGRKCYDMGRSFEFHISPSTARFLPRPSGGFLESFLSLRFTVTCEYNFVHFDK